MVLDQNIFFFVKKTKLLIGEYREVVFDLIPKKKGWTIADDWENIDKPLV